MEKQRQNTLDEPKYTEEEAVKHILQTLAQFKIDSRQRIASAIASFYGIPIQVATAIK